MSRASCPAPTQEFGGIIRHGAKLLYAFCEATVPEDHGDHPQSLRRRVRRDVLQAHPRRFQLRLSDRRDRGDGSRRRGQYRVPQPDRKAEDPGRREGAAGRRVSQDLRQPVQGRRAGLYRRSADAARHAAAADRGTQGARKQARSQSAAQSTAISRCERSRLRRRRTR